MRTKGISSVSVVLNVLNPSERRIELTYELNTDAFGHDEVSPISRGARDRYVNTLVVYYF